MTTSKKTEAAKFIHVQYHLDGVVLTKRIPALSLEDATATGRDLGLTDLIDLQDCEYVDGSVRLTGVYEA